MNTKSFYAIVGTLMLGAFAFGYFLAPGKVKTVTVETERKTDTERDKHKETIVVEIVKPDGTKEKTTKTVEDTNTKRNTETKEASKATEAPVSRSKLSIAALAGTELRLPITPVYGAHVSKEIIGPITVGAWGLTSGTFGISLGLNF